jgi:hypothetical protein
MQTLLLSSFLCLLLLASTNGQSSLSTTPTGKNSIQFMNSMVMAPGLFTFNWNVTSNSLIGEIVVNSTLGWMSLGIAGDSGWLVGSDLFVATIDSRGNVIFNDCYLKNGNVYVDRYQNWFLLNSSRVNATYTSILFKRKLNLCDSDPLEDLDIPNGTPEVIFAWGTLNSAGLINYPGLNSGSIPLPLKNVVKQAQKGVEEILGETVTQSFSITNVLLSSAMTTFKCRFFTVNAFNNKTNALQLIKVGYFGC